MIIGRQFVKRFYELSIVSRDRERLSTFGSQRPRQNSRRSSDLSKYRPFRSTCGIAVKSRMTWTVRTEPPIVTSQV